jgi:predicted RNA-binding protein with PUA-like domain
MHYWLMKTEGEVYPIDQLKKEKVTPWSGVRNYQARNFMQAMQKGDLVLFYHSSSKLNGVYGIARVAKIAHPDETQFDKKSDYYEPRATRAKPVWYCVDVAFVKKFKEPVTVHALKAENALKGMIVITGAPRLTVQPVSERHFRHIINMKG